MATAIMLLASAIMVAGIPAARSAFENILLGANAQSMLSATVAALRDELGGAWGVTVEASDDSRAEDGTGEVGNEAGDGADVTEEGDSTASTAHAIRYFSADTGAVSRISVDTDGTIMLAKANSVSDIISIDSSALVKHPLLVEGAADTGNLYVTYTDVSLGKSKESSTVYDLAVFSGIQVFRTKNSDGKPLAKLETLVIRLYTANIKTISTPSQS